jgi:putative DNA primase/helicase
MPDKALIDADGKFRFNAYVVGEYLKEKYTFATHIDSGIIYYYNGGYYDPRGEQIIAQECRNLLDEEATAHKIREVTEHIRQTTYRRPEEFEVPPNLINVKNGIYDIETDQLLPHNPKYPFLQQIPVEYKEGMDCPRIKEFLEQVAHKEDIPIIQEFVGYCLYRKHCFHRAMLLVGNGRNGKSTLLSLIRKFLGEQNVATPSLQALCNNRFAPAELYGKLACIHADLPFSRLVSTGMFKMLTGEDMIYAEKKRKDPFYFYNYAKLLFSTNRPPLVDDTTEAFWSRWIVIEFPNTFPENDPRTDPRILDKLTTPEELSGMLNWALEGLKRLLKQGHFSISKTSTEMQEKWASYSDSLRYFVLKAVKPEPSAWIEKGAFYEAYCKFCEDHDIAPQEKAMVGRRLPTLVPVTEIYKLGRIRAWKGITLLPPYDELVKDRMGFSVSTQQLIQLREQQ